MRKMVEAPAPEMQATQCPGELLPYVPLGQSEQDEAEPVEKVPIAHCKQYPNPALGEYDPAGHPKHAAEDVAPKVGL